MPAPKYSRRRRTRCSRRSTANADAAPPRDAAALLAAARRVAAVAAAHANAVDREARFPHEAFEAMRSERLLSAMIPREFGGDGLSLDEVARLCETLGASLRLGCDDLCDASEPGRVHRRSWRPTWRGSAICLHASSSEQWLLASATSEETIGGNMRTSACAVDLVDGAFTHRKARADDLLWRARRLHPRHRAPSSGCAAVGPGADRSASRHVRARTARLVGHARHARHLQ